jgi:outer membrane lipoprotein SlyB
MRYQRHYYGPGSIGDMPSGYALSRPPTIGSNDRPQNIAALAGCMGCMGTNGNGNGNGTAQATLAGALPISCTAGSEQPR